MLRLGVLCPAEIAGRYFLPAVSVQEEFEYIGIGCCMPGERAGQISEERIQKLVQRQREKAVKLTEKYGGRVFNGYEALLCSDCIDAVYIPLPPALHFEWAMKALQYGKHVLLEKPAALSPYEMKQIVEAASVSKLAVHENYMFEFHRQLREIMSILQKGEIGEIRMYRMSFGFPLRSADDFRYQKNMGGGALNDAGGYVIKLASILLGDTARIAYGHLNGKSGYEVDMYGTGIMVNDAGQEAHFSFGMDNQYKCELEVWGSMGTLYTGRIFTAPPDYVPEVVIQKQNASQTRALAPDNAFLRSLHHFYVCTANRKERKDQYLKMLHQSQHVDDVRRLDWEGGKDGKKDYNCRR